MLSVWPRLAVTRFCHNVADPAVRSLAPLQCGTGPPARRWGYCWARIGGFAMKPIGTIAISLALVSGAAVAQAQTAVTRQITSEPVETVVTQGPNGPAVPRRLLTPEPGVPSIAAPPLAYPPVAVQAVEPAYV